MDRERERDLHGLFYEQDPKRLLEELAVGGMPEAVRASVERRDLLEAQRIQTGLVEPLKAYRIILADHSTSAASGAQ